MKFYNTIFEEQETTINILYSEKILCIYSSRKSIILRLEKKLGKPTEVFKTKELVTGVKWEIPFKDKNKIRLALSKTLLIAQL